MAAVGLGQASFLGGSVLSRPYLHAAAPRFSRAPLACRASLGGRQGERVKRAIGGAAVAAAAVLLLQAPQANAFQVVDRYGVEAASSEGQNAPADRVESQLEDALGAVTEAVSSDAEPQVSSVADDVVDLGRALERAKSEVADEASLQLSALQDNAEDAAETFLESAQQAFDSARVEAKSLADSAVAQLTTPEEDAAETLLEGAQQAFDSARVEAKSSADSAVVQLITPEETSPQLTMAEPQVPDVPAAGGQDILESPAADVQAVLETPVALLEQLPDALAPAQSVLESTSSEDLWDPLLTVGIAVAVAGALTVGAVWSLVQSGKDEVTAEAALKALEEEGAALVDIRSKAEIARSGSPSLKSVGVTPVKIPAIVEDKDGTTTEVAGFIEAVKGAKGLEAGGPVLVILDKSGEAAGKVAKQVKGGAFAKVLTVKGGADAWKESGLAWRKPNTIFTLDLESVKEAISDIKGDSTIITGTLGVAAAATASLVLFSEAESALQLLGSVAMLQLFAKRLLYAEDRKQTLEQVQSYLNTKVVPQELADDIKEMGATLIGRDTVGQLSEEEKAEGDSVVSLDHPEGKTSPPPPSASLLAKGTDHGGLKDMATVPDPTAPTEFGAKEAEVPNPPAHLFEPEAKEQKPEEEEGKVEAVEGGGIDGGLGVKPEGEDVPLEVAAKEALPAAVEEAEQVEEVEKAGEALAGLVGVGEEKPVEEEPVVEEQRPEEEPVVAERKPEEEPVVAEQKPKEEPVLAEQKPEEEPVVTVQKPKEEPVVAGQKPEEESKVAEEVPEAKAEGALTQAKAEEKPEEEPVLAEPQAVEEEPRVGKPEEDFEALPKKRAQKEEEVVAPAVVAEQEEDVAEKPAEDAGISPQVVAEKKQKEDLPSFSVASAEEEEKREPAEESLVVAAKQEEEEVAEFGPGEPVIEETDPVVPVVESKQEDEEVEENLTAAAEEVKAEVKKNLDEERGKEPEAVQENVTEATKGEVKASLGGGVVADLASEAEAVQENVPERESLVEAQSEEVKDKVKSQKGPLMELAKAAEEKELEEEALLVEALAPEPDEELEEEERGEEPQEDSSEVRQRAAASAAVEEALAPETETREEEEKKDSEYSSQEANGADVAANNSEEDEQETITISYESGWESAYILFSADSGPWNEVPGLRMENKGGTLKTVTVQASRLEFVLTDGKGDWDSPALGRNYRIEGGGTYRLSFGQIDELSPATA